MVYLIKILPGNLPKWKNQSIPTIPGSYVIGISSPFCGDAALHICFRSREHKKRRCPFASTPLRLPVLRGNQAAVGVGGFRNQPLGVILLIGTLLWNNIKMISCIYNIYIYVMSVSWTICISFSHYMFRRIPMSISMCCWQAVEEFHTKNQMEQPIIASAKNGTCHLSTEFSLVASKTIYFAIASSS